MKKVLIIDDHPAMIEGYKAILRNGSNGDTYIITTAQDCESAFNILKRNCASKLHFDLIFLDVILPSYNSAKIFSGMDLMAIIREFVPESKIIILTSHSESLTLYKIVKDLRPHALLVKSDFSSSELLAAVQEVEKGEIYYSSTVKLSIKKMLRKNIYLDRYNRQIIILLGQGIKTKSLPSHLNLSISAIDKRKVQIKEFFEIEKGNDEDIIRKAREDGFI